ncbi:hypothetical protein GALMADRAFT_333663 [Galerina marginata CBS 339.88]|uniref:Uncharacterized protein n=1 Tax=Galerina marginata (strain CBS 339.88) TaxID=685588 RepID=A0A067U1I0_GALM3|nr:hypothetical protein GALMADRAFT_333663 [Galerina marginata CBS 339.88]
MVSRDTIIIVVVCGVIAALILLVLVARVIRKASATSNPLPPVQPLAHLREQQLAKLEGTLPRSQTWYNTQNLNHLAAPQPFGSMSARGSRASLLTKNSPVDEESATSCSPMSDEPSLPIPSPSFHPARPGSSSSLGSSEPGHPPPPTSPHLDPPPPFPRSGSSSPGRRSRPLSTASSHSTIYSKASRHTLRGTPHGPHSQIQIILPTPLGTETGGDVTAQRRISRFDTDSVDRRSIADRWISPGTASGEDMPIPVPRVPSMYNVVNN